MSVRATAAQIADDGRREALALRERLLGRISGAIWKVGAIDDASMRALRANSEASFRELDRMIENQWIDGARA